MRKSCFYAHLLLVLVSLNFRYGQAQVYFQDVAQNAGIDHLTYGSGIYHIGPMYGGAAWLDFDNDGWEDLYITGGAYLDKLYRNEGNGSFQDVSVMSGISLVTDGIPTVGVASADINRDGWEDIVVTTEEQYPVLLLMNNGNGTFSNEAIERGIVHIAQSAGVSVADFDQDGWIDLYFANWRNGPLQSTTSGTAYPDRLYRNDGDGTFTDVTSLNSMWSESGCGLAPCFTDFDLDGDADLLLANDFGELQWTDENRLYENVSGVFQENTDMKFNIPMFGMGIAVGDYDEDLDLDYYLTDIGVNTLLRNDIDSFANQTSAAGVGAQLNFIDTADLGPDQQALVDSSWGWGTAFLDYDNDSYLDLMVSNGSWWSSFLVDVRPDQNRLYRNNQASGIFEDVSIVSGFGSMLSNRGCALADYDKDGDMDIVIVTTDTVNSDSRTLLMNNSGGNTSGNWLELNLQGTISNLDAIGSVVYIHFDGRTLMREVDSGGGGFLSHHSKIVHFGLGSVNSIDSVVIMWPSGNRDMIPNISINQIVEVVEGGELVTAIQSQEGDSELRMNYYPNPSSGRLFVSARNELLRSITHFDIVDMRISQVIEIQTFTNPIMLNESIRSGIYLLRFYDSGKNLIGQSRIVLIRI